MVFAQPNGIVTAAAGIVPSSLEKLMANDIHTSPATAGAAAGPPTDAPASDISYGRLFGVAIGTRLIVDTGVQFFNPFLPIIAEGLRTNIITMGWLVGVRSLVGLLSPLFGALADRYGFRLIMRLGLALGGVGALLVGVSSSVSLATVGMILWGIGVASFVPNLQAYISARLPYSQRARGIGILEYSWALAGIIGLFVMGQLIAQFSWRTPFFVLGFGMLIMGLVMGILPRARVTPRGPNAIPNATSQEKGAGSWLVRARSFFALGDNARSAYATMVAAAALFIAAMQLMITHGAWLRAEYALSAAQLGVVALIMGLADLCGSGSVSLLTDRFGKRRSVQLGVVGAAIGFLVMPLLNISLVMAVVGIAVARAFFEFAIVSNIPLLSEQAPQQRGKVMTLGAAFNLCGATIAGFTGPWLYTNFGVWGLGLSSTLLSLLSSIIIWRWVEDVST